MSELSGKSKRSIMGSILPKAKPPKADPTDSMSFLDHLEELRWRIIKGVAGILIGIIVAFFFSDFLIKEFILGSARARKSTRLNSSHVAISYSVLCSKQQ